MFRVDLAQKKRGLICLIAPKRAPLRWLYRIKFQRREQEGFKSKMWRGAVRAQLDAEIGSAYEDLEILIQKEAKQLEEDLVAERACQTCGFLFGRKRSLFLHLPKKRYGEVFGAAPKLHPPPPTGRRRNKRIAGKEFTDPRYRQVQTGLNAAFLRNHPQSIK